MPEPKKRPKAGPWYQRSSDGLWLAPIEMGVVNGKRKRKVVTAKTEAQVKKKYNEALVQKANGTLLTERSQTLSAWLDTWFNEISLKSIRPRTAAGYRSKIEQYIKPAIGHVRLDKLGTEHVRELERFITAPPPAGKGLSSTSASQAHRILSVALKHAMWSEKVTKNVATRTPAPVRAAGDIAILTPLNGMKVLAATAGERLGSRAAAALLSGARQGELLGLEIDRVGNDLDLSWQLQRISWEHGCSGECGRKRGTDCPDRKLTAPANWEHRHLTGGLYLSRPKSKKSWRIIPLVEPLRSILLRRIEVAKTEPNPHGLVWTADRKYSKGGRHEDRNLLPLDGSPIEPSRDNAAWHRALTAAGVPDVPLHAARHTTASLLLLGNVPPTVIQKILGHSTFAMSQHYMDVDRPQLVDAMKAVSALMPFDTPDIEHMVPPERG